MVVYVWLGVSCCVKVAVQDLAADGDSSLVGYWGGFSGEVDGSALGFLSPLFNGEDFHGNAVQASDMFFLSQEVESEHIGYAAASSLIRDTFEKVP